MPESGSLPPSSDAHRQTARSLLEGFALSDPEVARHLEQALARDYWRRLAPDLSLDGPVPDELEMAPPVEASQVREAAARVAVEGYFTLDDVINVAVIGRMRRAVHAVVAADWPPVFAWIYDEFWRVPRVPPLVQLLSACLGSHYRQTPYVWTHVVSGERGASGWRPHVDNAADDARLTVWIPLTDASVASGCMSLIPKHLAPRRDAGPWHAEQTLATKEAMTLLHAARSIPSGPGGVLGWESNVMHWGSARQTAGDPRVSVSMEFIAADATASALTGALPGSSPDLPDFEERLRIIARGLTIYQSSEPRAARYARLANRLLEHLARA